MIFSSFAAFNYTRLLHGVILCHTLYENIEKYIYFFVIKIKASAVTVF